MIRCVGATCGFESAKGVRPRENRSEHFIGEYGIWRGVNDEGRLGTLMDDDPFQIVSGSGCTALTYELIHQSGHRPW
jgi:hypothetical protein